MRRIFRCWDPKIIPTLSELYGLIEAEYKGFDSGERQLYTAELLQNILLGLHSMCRGPEAKFFSGHTNITDSSFVTFGVKGVLQASRNLRDALLFNTLSFHEQPASDRGAIQWRDWMNFTCSSPT